VGQKHDPFMVTRSVDAGSTTGERIKEGANPAGRA
jgi:hypothetical protein